MCASESSFFFYFVCLVTVWLSSILISLISLFFYSSFFMGNSVLSFCMVLPMVSTKFPGIEFMYLAAYQLLTLYLDLQLFFIWLNLLLLYNLKFCWWNCRFQNHEIFFFYSFLHCLKIRACRQKRMAICGQGLNGFPFIFAFLCSHIF